MSRYIIRLDDACEKMHVANWRRMEELLDRYSVRPLVGIIPHCEDPAMDGYAWDESFWAKTKSWQDKGWQLALHGYNHVYSTECGGINPIQKRSEFAGEPLDVQKAKIAAGIEILRSHGLEPKVFFAPSHTFDENTLKALSSESSIRIISDTPANAPYCKGGFTFVPQQSGHVRKLPLKLVTFCYHPNTMNDSDFSALEAFLSENSELFTDFPAVECRRKRSLFDIALEKIYFARRK